MAHVPINLGLCCVCHTPTSDVVSSARCAQMWRHAATSTMVAEMIGSHIGDRSHKVLKIKLVVIHFT